MGQVQTVHKQQEMANLDNMISHKQDQLNRLQREREVIVAELGLRRENVESLKQQARDEQEKWNKEKDQSYYWYHDRLKEEKLLKEFRESLESKKQQAQKEYEELRLQLQKDFEQYRTEIIHKKNALLESIIQLQQTKLALPVEQPAPPYNEMPSAPAAKELTS
jgi:hypothetical protein